MTFTLTSYIQAVQQKLVSPQEVAAAYIKKAKDNPYNAFVRTHDDYVHDHVDIFSQRSLHAAPIGIKDIILTKGYETSCGSAILTGYKAPYSATCFERLEKAGGLMLGKTNMDEFAMGGSNETSAFGPALNPYDLTRIPGGSSGGSAVAVAADLCLAALGTDTGGSVRQPASLCGVVGVKPTYGRVSRYGVQALSSSLDQVGTFTKTVEDAVTLLSAIGGYDPYDAVMTDHDAEMETRKKALHRDTLQGIKLAVPKQFFAAGLDSEVEALCKKTLDLLQKAGAQIDRIDLPVLQYGVPVYYILMPADASTNLARFDGIRFGLQKEPADFDDIYAYYAAVRQAGFGEEVMRRIFVGTYVLSAGYYDAFYHKALQVRAQLQRDLHKVYEQYDAVVGPTSPSVAWKLGEKADDPIAMYLADIYTVIANLAGTPALSLPIGTVVQDGATLPVGFQIMTRHRNEEKLFGIASVVEKLVAYTPPPVQTT